MRENGFSRIDIFSFLFPSLLFFLSFIFSSLYSFLGAFSFFG